MKKAVLILIIGLSLFSAGAQNIIWATPAKLQVYGMTNDGSQVSLTSENLIVLYDQLNMTGELNISDIQTSDGVLQSLLDSAAFEKITFTATLPEGKFVYHDMLEDSFPVETELHYGDLSSKIMLTYVVSNRKTSLANTFDITVSGSLSLLNDLGVSRLTGLDDKISFMFYQNVQTRTY